MNVSWVLYRREDNKWGSLLPDGSFNGMISSVVKGEADVVAASLTNMPQRQKGVDFLVGELINYNTRLYVYFTQVALGTESNGIFIRRAEVGENDLDWTVYVDPFTRDVWRMLLVYCILCAVVIKVLGSAVTGY